MIVDININQVIEGAMRFDGFCYALKQALSRTRVQRVGICLLCTQGRWYVGGYQQNHSDISRVYPFVSHPTVILSIMIIIVLP